MTLKAIRMLQYWVYNFGHSLEEMQEMFDSLCDELVYETQRVDRSS